MLQHRQAGRRGVMTLRTLRRPTVADYKVSYEHKSEGTSKEQLELLQRGGLDGLLHLLSYEHVRVQALAPKIASKITLNEDDEVTLVNEAAWNLLFELCAVKELDVRRDAVWTVAILAAQQDTHEFISSVFGWKSILKLSEGGDADLKIATSILIANLASTEENQAALIANGGLRILMEQAKATKDLQERRATATALANAMIEAENAKIFADEGGLELLKIFLKEKDNELTEVVVSAMANISAGDDSEIKSRVVKDIGLEVLAEGLSNKNASIRRAAAIAIGHLSAQEEHLVRLMDLKVIDKMIILVKAEPVEDASTLGGVAMALNNFSMNSKAGKEMYEAGVSNFLGVLLKSTDSDIKSEAEATVANLGLYGPVKPRTDNSDDDDDDDDDRSSSNRVSSSDRSSSPSPPPRPSSSASNGKNSPAARTSVGVSAGANNRNSVVSQGSRHSSRSQRSSSASSSSSAASGDSSDSSQDSQSDSDSDASDKQSHVSRHSAQSRHSVQSRHSAASHHSRQSVVSRHSAASQQSRHSVGSKKIGRAESASSMSSASSQSDSSQSESDSRSNSDSSDSENSDEVANILNTIDVNPPSGSKGVRASIRATQDSSPANKRMSVRSPTGPSSTTSPVQHHRQSIRADPVARVQADEGASSKSPHYSASPLMNPFSPPTSHHSFKGSGETRANAADIQRYVAMLASGVLQQEKEGAAGLVSLARNSAEREVVVGGMGTRGLNEIHRLFISNRDSGLLLDLCRIFCIVAATIKDKIRFNEIAGTIIGMLASSLDLQTEALVLLPPLLFKNPNNQAFMLKANGIDILMNLIRHGQTPEIKGRAGKCLHSLVYTNRGAQEQVGKKKQMDLIVSLLESPELPVQKAGAGVIYAIADGHTSNQNALRKAGAVPLMTRLLSSSDEPVRQTAAGAFFAVMKDNRKIIEESQGAIQSLIYLLQSRSIGILSNTTAAVSEITRVSEKAGDWFCNQEASQCLIHILSLDDFWVVYNSLCIIEYITKKRTPSKRRETFRAAGIEAALQPHINNSGVSNNVLAIKKVAGKILNHIREKKA